MHSVIVQNPKFPKFPKFPNVPKFLKLPQLPKFPKFPTFLQFPKEELFRNCCTQLWRPFTPANATGTKPYSLNPATGTRGGGPCRRRLFAAWHLQVATSLSPRPADCPSAAQTINFCRQDNKFLSSICDVAEAVAHWHLGEFEHVLISVDDAISLC